MPVFVLPFVVLAAAAAVNAPTVIVDVDINDEVYGRPQPMTEADVEALVGRLHESGCEALLIRMGYLGLLPYRTSLSYPMQIQVAMGQNGQFTAQWYGEAMVSDMYGQQMFYKITEIFVGQMQGVVAPARLVQCLQHLGPDGGMAFAVHLEVARVDLPLLVGVDRSRDPLLANTRQFARGYPANNALLWGARGMGKSSLVKAGVLPRLEVCSDDFSRPAPARATEVATTNKSYCVLPPMRPTDRPVRALAALLAAELAADFRSLQDFGSLDGGDDALAQIVAGWAAAQPGQRLVPEGRVEQVESRQGGGQSQGKRRRPSAVAVEGGPEDEREWC